MPILAALVLAAAITPVPMPPGVVRYELPHPLEGVAFTPTGTAWTGSASNGALHRFEPNGTFSFAQTLPSGASVLDMAAAPDGAIWISTPLYLARLEPGSGNVVTFATWVNLPRLVAAPDGSVWFPHGSSVVNVAANGTLLATHTLPLPISSVALGPNGTVWAVRGSTAFRVGSPLATYALPADGLLFFTGGNVWLVGSSGTLYGLAPEDLSVRIAYGLSNPNVDVTEILAETDPAGDLWLSVTSLSSDSESTELIRVTPARTLVRYTRLPGLIPHAFCNYVLPTDLAITADGRVALTHRYSTETVVTPIGCAVLPNDHLGRLTIVDTRVWPVSGETHLDGHDIPLLGAWQLLALAVGLSFVAWLRMR